MFDDKGAPRKLVISTLNFVMGAESDSYLLLPVDRLLLLALAKHNGSAGICPGTKTLARECKVTPTYIKQRINHLDEQKLIKVERKFGCGHRYELLFLSTNQSTTVDQSTTLDRSTTVSPTGQPQFRNRSTGVDTIRTDKEGFNRKERERASRASLSDCKFFEQHENLASIDADTASNKNYQKMNSSFSGKNLRGRTESERGKELNRHATPHSIAPTKNTIIKKTPLPQGFTPSPANEIALQDASRKSGKSAQDLMTKFKNLQKTKDNRSADWQASLENFLINEKPMAFQNGNGNPNSHQITPPKPRDFTQERLERESSSKVAGASQKSPTEAVIKVSAKELLAKAKREQGDVHNESEKQLQPRTGLGGKSVCQD